MYTINDLLMTFDKESFFVTTYQRQHRRMERTKRRKAHRQTLLSHQARLRRWYERAVVLAAAYDRTSRRLTTQELEFLEESASWQE